MNAHLLPHLPLSLFAVITSPSPSITRIVLFLLFGLIMTKLSVKDANFGVMEELNHHVDSLLKTSSWYDTELQKYCSRFQMEHAASRAQFQQVASQSTDETLLAPDMQHLLATLKQMIELSIPVASLVLRRVIDASSGRSPVSTSSFPSVDARDSDPIEDVHELRASSVEGVDEASWIECGANLMHSATQVLALTPVVHPALRKRLQTFLLEQGVVKQALEALTIPKELELSYFAVGYKTDWMRLLANVTFESEDVCQAISRSHALFGEVMRATKIDDDNPHLAEWAEFSLRNILNMSKEAQEHLASMKAAAFDAETEQLLSQGAAAPLRIDPSTGKIVAA